MERYTSLVNQLQSELNLSRMRCCGCDQPRGGTRCCTGEYNGIRISQIRVVEGVEEFRSELEADSFGYARVFR